MKFSYNWLQSFFEKELPKPNELAELLTAHSFEVESLEETRNQEMETRKDWMLDIDILPNRAHDCLSHYGLAREIAAVTGVQVPRKYLAARPPSAGGQKGLLTVKIDGAGLCPRYDAYVLESVRVVNSPDWIKERLDLMGQKAINNVVDITNYVMWELGQPLHAFDLDKIHGAKMNIRLSKSGDKLETLDKATHDLGDGAIIIEDAERVIDLAGIKGGANTQIANDTQKIIFQAAIFDPTRIRRTTQKLGANTDASVRYMHGFDPNLPPQALERAVELLQETNPDAKIIQRIDMYPEPTKAKKVILDINYVNKLLGTYLSIREARQILERLGFDIRKEKVFQISSFKLQVSVPSYRLDVSIPEDLIEEIGRIHGYENIKAEPPRGTLVAPHRNERVFWRNKAREILAGFGFSEVYNYSLTYFGGGSFAMETANPVSDGFRYLRRALWPGVLKNVSLNQKFFDNIQFFEVGKTFSRKDNGVEERENLIFAISASDSSPDEFYRSKGYLDEFLKKLGITDFYLDPALSEEEERCFFFLHPARRANVLLNGEKVGFIGEVHPRTREEFDVKQRVYCAELDFEKVTAAAEEEQIYQKPSKYPEVVRDIALLVPRETMVEEALNVIETAGGPLLRDTDLFDMYEGENLPEGMKNFAFHLLFQSDERTLTAEEVDWIMEKIYRAARDEGWEVR